MALIDKNVQQPKIFLEDRANIGPPFDQPLYVQFFYVFPQEDDAGHDPAEGGQHRAHRGTLQI